MLIFLYYNAYIFATICCRSFLLEIISFARKNSQSLIRHRFTQSICRDIGIGSLRHVWVSFDFFIICFFLDIPPHTSPRVQKLYIILHIWLFVYMDLMETQVCCTVHNMYNISVERGVYLELFLLMFNVNNFIIM